MLAILVSVGVLLQEAAIAFAWFDVISAIDSGQAYVSEDDGNVGHALHGIVGMTLIAMIALALLMARVTCCTPDAGCFALFPLGSCQTIPATKENT